MNSQLLNAAGALGFALFAISATAQQAGHTQDAGGKKMNAAKATKLTEGEVKNVDAEAGYVTLKYGAIENMNMGPMTMAFAVKDKSVLSSLKEGSKVTFAVENFQGVPKITSLIPQ